MKKILYQKQLEESHIDELDKAISKLPPPGKKEKNDV